MDSLETDRLLLRPVQTSDAKFILTLWNSPTWIQYIGDRNVKTTADAEVQIQHKIISQHDRLGFSTYLMITKTENWAVGTCGLYDRPGLERIDLGFALLPEYEGYGYALEASIALRDHAITQLKLPLAAITSNDNRRSQRLLKKLGFQYKRNITLPGDKDNIRYYELE